MSKLELTKDPLKGISLVESIKVNPDEYNKETETYLKETVAEEVLKQALVSEVIKIDEVVTKKIKETSYNNGVSQDSSRNAKILETLARSSHKIVTSDPILFSNNLEDAKAIIATKAILEGKDIREGDMLETMASLSGTPAQAKIYEMQQRLHGDKRSKRIDVSGSVDSPENFQLIAEAAYRILSSGKHKQPLKERKATCKYFIESVRSINPKAADRVEQVFEKNIKISEAGESALVMPNFNTIGQGHTTYAFTNRYIEWLSAYGFSDLFPELPYTPVDASASNLYYLQIGGSAEVNMRLNDLATESVSANTILRQFGQAFIAASRSMPSDFTDMFANRAGMEWIRLALKSALYEVIYYTKDSVNTFGIPYLIDGIWTSPTNRQIEIDLSAYEADPAYATTGQAMTQANYDTFKEGMSDPVTGAIIDISRAVTCNDFYIRNKADYLNLDFLPFSVDKYAPYDYGLVPSTALTAFKKGMKASGGQPARYVMYLNSDRGYKDLRKTNGMFNSFINTPMGMTSFMVPETSGMIGLQYRETVICATGGWINFNPQINATVIYY